MAARFCGTARRHLGNDLEQDGEAVWDLRTFPREVLADPLHSSEERDFDKKRDVPGADSFWTISSLAVGTTDEDEIPLAALGTEGEAWLASQIRAAARMALLSRDASDKIRRATLR